MAGASFALDVGSDLFGTKRNAQLRFPAQPSVAELAAATESYFDTKARACRPAGYPDVPFRVETFQVFDDTLMRWVDLYDGQQLASGQQVWCFQPESIWHSDAQGVIPETEPAAITFTTPMGSPRRGRQAADAGVPPTLSEKLRSVFYQIDQGSKGYLLFQDLDSAFRRCDMEFNGTTAGELFQAADANRSNHITYDEWVNFAIRCPIIVDALFFRFRDMGPMPPAVAQVSAPPDAAAPSVADQQARQQQLQQYYQDQWGERQRQQQAAEFEAARAKQSEADAAAEAAAAAQAAQQAQDRQRAADQAAAQAAAEQQAAQAAADDQARRAQEAAQRHQALAAAAQDAQARAAAEAQQAQAQAQADEAARQAALQPPPPSHPQPQPQYSQQPAAQPSYPVAAPQHQPAPTTSPQREEALRQYEAARRYADDLRMQKEAAERDERNAWDRLYYSPASPHYAP